MSDLRKTNLFKRLTLDKKEVELAQFEAEVEKQNFDAMDYKRELSNKKDNLTSQIERLKSYKNREITEATAQLSKVGSVSEFISAKKQAFLAAEKYQSSIDDLTKKLEFTSLEIEYLDEAISSLFKED